MCIIVVKPIGISVTRRELYNCWSNNTDGAGFMYADPEAGKIYIRKELSSFPKLYKSIRRAERDFGEVSPFVFHFRRKTIGNVNPSNTHPFRVSDKVAFCHNGSITFGLNEGVPKDEDISDTRWFARTILGKLNPGFYRNKATMMLIQDFSPHSKMAFLDSRGKVFICNEEAGIWDEHRWFSNESYRNSKDELDKAEANKKIPVVYSGRTASNMVTPAGVSQSMGFNLHGAAPANNRIADNSGNGYHPNGYTGPIRKCSECGTYTKLLNGKCEWCASKHRCSICNEPMVGTLEIKQGICFMCQREQRLKDNNWSPSNPVWKTIKGATRRLLNGHDSSSEGVAC